MISSRFVRQSLLMLCFYMIVAGVFAQAVSAEYEPRVGQAGKDVEWVPTCQELVDKMARYSPILRFILVDPEERNFIAERRSYFSDVVDWVTTGDLGRLDKLARRLIPKLGTDDFFELF